MPVLLVALAVSVVVGLALARMLRRRHPEGPSEGADRDWINVEDLTGPAMTLAALLLAFMLVQTFGSYQRAETHAASEAGQLDAAFHAAALLPTGDRDSVQGDLVCYGRAVTSLEWPSLADGEPSPIAQDWVEALEDDVVAAAQHDPDRLTLSDLTEVQDDLAVSRDERIAEAEPAVPPLMTGIVELTALLVLMLLVGFTWHLGGLVRSSLVASVAVMFLLLIVGIRELDTPFSGAMHIAPTQLERSLARMDPTGPVPCGADGAPSARSS